jgi:TetR/AcrR family transcriptional repressor of nem operon
MPRAREYDESALISLAMNTFWSRGYRGTSIEDLVSESGVSRASLYTAYPDKRGLFIQSIKRYLDEIVEGNVRRLNEVEPAGEAIRQFFITLVSAPAARLRRGCLLTNSAAELSTMDKETAALIRSALKRMEDAFCARLVEARKAGDLTAGVNPRSYARQLVTLLQGIRIMSRVDVDRKTLKDVVKAALSALRQQGKRRAPTARATQFDARSKNRQAR